MASTTSTPETSTPETIDPWEAITTPATAGNPKRLRLPQARSTKLALAAAAALLVASGITTGATWVCLEVARHDAGVALQKSVAAVQPQVDLAPKLITALRNDAPLEKGIINDAVLARNGIAVYDPGTDGSSQTFDKYAEAESAVSSSLAHLVAKVNQDHPKLVASADFTALVQQLKDQTPAIDEANSAYNKAAHRYNSYRESFPGNLVAPLIGHGEPFGYLEGP